MGASTPKPRGRRTRDRTAEIRLAQPFTGGVSSEIVRRCARHPDLEVVAVLVHSDDKAGKDAGALVGADANGIITTQSVDDVLAARPDAAILPPGPDVCRCWISPQSWPATAWHRGGIEPEESQ